MLKTFKTKLKKTKLNIKKLDLVPQLFCLNYK